ncbi:hypothetical protein M2189_001691 [Bradyrhizobium japonicum]|uniref:hypothetical protein n=1 Tax=Bradyrhizobium japonicum TaxID=375 RepID=UPI0021687985|nr:hypothetical protein [Bradyrhizobium japonicum]MCS3499348.1 hypothetical protein [Bradyrhizobium japonicum]MCS3958488.1 hypothetical protein [Bradyrhizobium japonicum]MCS4000242.1 hypothetical protein [Bradyrhizobium japonicum]
MGSNEVMVFLIPDVDPARYSHNPIHAMVSEDLAVKKIIDTDSTSHACRIARHLYPEAEVLVHLEAPVQEAIDCKIVTSLPLWACRIRADIAIHESRAEGIRRLPAGMARDIFFQGVGALLKFGERLVHESKTRVAIGGEFKSKKIACDVDLQFGVTEAFSSRGTICHRAGVESRREKQSFELSIAQEPAALVDILSAAYEMPGIPKLATGHTPPAFDEEDLVCLGVAIAAATVDPRTTMRIHLHNNSMDLKATAVPSQGDALRD